MFIGHWAPALALASRRKSAGIATLFLAGQIEQVDRINPQVAARLARRFDRWTRFDALRQAHARSALEGLRAINGLSSDVREIVGRALD